MSETRSHKRTDDAVRCYVYRYIESEREWREVLGREFARKSAGRLHKIFTWKNTVVRGNKTTQSATRSTVVKTIDTTFPLQFIALVAPLPPLTARGALRNAISGGPGLQRAARCVR